jgi:hypothetical protein
MDHLDRRYAAMGKAFHEDGRPTQEPGVHRAVLAEAGFDAGILDEAIADPTTTDDVRADHDHAVTAFGAFGVPTIVFPSAGSGEATALYQQLVPAPHDPDEAVALFDWVVGFNRFGHLYELKHPKRAADIGVVADTFAPYLSARSWQTIENPAP